MNKIIGRRLLAAVVIISLICIQSGMNVRASEVNVLSEYEKELIHLNEEMGTTYVLSPYSISEQDMIDFFTGMSLEEFDEYIYSLYHLDVGTADTFDEETNVELDGTIDMGDSSRPLSTSLLTQRFYYDNSNNLFLQSYIDVTNSTVKYTGARYDIGSQITNYLGYAYLTGTGTTSYYNNGQNVDCTWLCTRHLSKYVADGVQYTISCTFTVDGGNAYGAV